MTLTRFRSLLALSVVCGVTLGLPAHAETPLPRAATAEDTHQWFRLPLFIPSPPYSYMVKELRRIADETAELTPDPIESLRSQIEDTLARTRTDKTGDLYPALLELYRKFEPEKADPAPIDPNVEALREIRRRTGSALD